MALVTIYSPVAQTRAPSFSLAPRIAAFAGKRVAFLDNRKANAAALLRGIAGALPALVNGQARFESKDATAAAPDAVMAHLRTCDAVVLAIAD